MADATTGDTKMATDMLLTWYRKEMAELKEDAAKISGTLDTLHIMRRAEEMLAAITDEIRGYWAQTQNRATRRLRKQEHLLASAEKILADHPDWDWAERHVEREREWLGRNQALAAQARAVAAEARALRDELKAGLAEMEAL